MPWTESDYPSSWKNLSEELRAKAIGIGNALLDDGMAKGDAIPIALAQARKALDDGPADDLWVSPHGDGWALRREKADEPERTFATKHAAVEAGVTLARDLGSALTVQRGDGTIEDRQSFRSRLD